MYVSCIRISISCIALLLFTSFFPTLGVAKETILVSQSSTGEAANHGSWYPSISADGRFVAYHSDATNLVMGETSGNLQIYVRGLEKGTTTLVSKSSTGNAANRYSWYSSISADGRFVAFESTATNLVGEETGGYPQAYVRDLEAGTTSLVSKSSTGDAADSDSRRPSISADGRFVAYHSDATNLVGEDTKDVTDVFIRKCYWDRYVSPEGDDGILGGFDNNDCRLSDLPCRTLNRAVAVSEDLDVLHMAQGTYAEQLSLPGPTILDIEGGWNTSFTRMSQDPARTRIDAQGLGTTLRLEALANPLSIKLSNLSLVNGKSSTRGSGIDLDCAGDNRARVVLENCVLSGHGGTGLYRGAMEVHSGTGGELDLTLDRCRFLDNLSGSYGAALHLATSADSGVTSVELVNSILAGNTAMHNGGAIWLSTPSQAHVTLRNTTVTRNTAYSGGGLGLLYGEQGNTTLDLINSIVWGNSGIDSITGNDDLHVMSIAPSTDHLNVNSIGSDIGEKSSITPVLSEVFTINADPLFRAPDRHDYHLTPRSPARDTGLCSFYGLKLAPDTDFEGHARPFGPSCDMGADEFRPAGLPWMLLLQ